MLFNPNTVDRSPDLLPVALYPMQAVKMERVWKDNGDFMIKAEFDVADGEHQGRKVFENYNLQHSNPKAEKIGRENLAELCDAVEISHLFQGDGIDLETIEDDQLTELFCFKPFTAKVKIQQDKTGQFKDQNRIGEYKPFGHTEPQRGPAPPRGPAPQHVAPQQSARPAQQTAQPQQQGSARPAQGGNTGMPWDRAAAARR